jgi:murein DD-endopeptidase MepM/ murein hydrolase activator NlpD
VLPKHYELPTLCAKIEPMNITEKIMPCRSLSFAGKSCLFYGVVLFLLFTPVTRTADTGDVRITYIHRQRSLQPGEVVFIEARSSRPLKSLKVEAFKRIFPAFSETDRMVWTALVGIDLGTAVGRHEMVLKGAGMDGKDVTATGNLLVKTKSFPSRRLMVEEKYVTPPAGEMSRIEAESKRVNAIFGSITPVKIWNGSFHVPVPGPAISAFGKRNIYNGEPRNPHSGVDFRGASGTPVRAPSAGRVALASLLYFSGNTIILDHGLGLYSYLAHLSEFSVKEGDLVEGGDIIGRVGATGRVTGPHLHWTVRLVTALVDPLSLISVLKAPQ